MVVNAPTSNIVSAAEHAIALLLAVGPQRAGRELVAAVGQWKRSAFTGVEWPTRPSRSRLADRRAGRPRLSRSGPLLAYDPYVQPARAAQIGVRWSA
jgi:D-3-phosphoglycerate dehydrogenase